MKIIERSAGLSVSSICIYRDIFRVQFMINKGIVCWFYTSRVRKLGPLPMANIKRLSNWGYFTAYDSGVVSPWIVGDGAPGGSQVGSSNGRGASSW